MLWDQVGYKVQAEDVAQILNFIVLEPDVPVGLIQVVLRPSLLSD
jgi:hypothetical protein